MRTFFSFVLVLAAFLASNRALAFPGNVRHGYPNCTACHVSPGGGGVLTAYGRELSREIQSAKGGEGETAFIYGMMKTPEWLDAGGDLRYIQLVQDTPTTIEGRGFWMQADVEAAVHIGKFTADAAVGWKGNSDGLVKDNSVLSRRHYAMVALDDRFSIRAGRFYPVFGIMQPEHEDATRARLGFNQGLESYNLEFADQNESGSLFITPIFGKLRSGRQADEKGLALSKNWIVGGNTRVGFSLLGAKTFHQSAYSSRFVIGPNAIVTLSKQVFWVVEADLERRTIGDGTDHQSGFYQYQKITYEPVQGVQLSGRQDLQRRLIGDSRTQAISVGPVVDWFPRPHFDLQVSLSRVLLPASAPDFWMYSGVLHFYL